MEAILAKFDALNKQMEEAKARVRKEGESLFTEATQFIFEQHPRLISFGWTQYTPYFNDGDSCEFSVNKDLYINGFHEWDDSLEGEGENLIELGDKRIWSSEQSTHIENKDYDPEAGKIVEDVNNLMEKLDEDMLYDLFGDHVQVTIHREEGVIKDEYDHD